MEYAGITMSLLLVLLLVLSVLVLAAGHAGKRQLYLSGAMMSVASGLFQSLYFLLVPQSDRCNLILLLPMKLSFLPVWLSFSSLRNFRESGRLSGILRLSRLLSFLEISVYILPMGALLFMHEYTRPILDYLFTIQKYSYTVFSVYAVAVSALIWHDMERMHDGEAWSVRGIPAVLAAIGLSAALSVHQKMFGIYSEILYYVPLVMSAAALSALAAYELHVMKVGTADTETDDAVKKSGRAEQFAMHVKSLILEKELYLKPDLRISEIAELMSLSPNYLSRMLNDASGEGFNDMVNRMRTDRFIRKIEGKEFRYKTLSGIACECGFNSKTTFNASFKKIMGMTPSQYVRTVAEKER